MIKLFIIISIAFLGFSCASRDNVEFRRPTKNVAKPWKQYYEKCLDENPDNKQKCDELKQMYETELESIRESTVAPDTGQEPYN